MAIRLQLNLVVVVKNKGRQDHYGALNKIAQHWCGIIFDFQLLSQVVSLENEMIKGSLTAIDSCFHAFS